MMRNSEQGFQGGKGSESVGGKTSSNTSDQEYGFRV